MLFFKKEIELFLDWVFSLIVDGLTKPKLLKIIKERIYNMDFIAKSDADFYNQAKHYNAYVKVNFAALGLTLDDATKLDAAFLKFENSYFAHLAAIAASEAASQTKTSDKSSLISIIREDTKVIQANPSVTNAQKAELGVTVPKETKTAAPVPTTRPIADIDNKQRLQHIIHFFDEGSVKSKAKPEGVRGCEIWCKIGGEPPLDENETKYLATDTKTPYIAHFDGADGGKTAHYMLRWVNTRNEPGPWSETISVTISA